MCTGLPQSTLPHMPALRPHLPRAALVALAVLVPATAAHAATTVVVADQNDNKISAYPLGSSTPARTITGTNTGLAMPLNLARDRTGNIYATNIDAGSVTVYAATANGNVLPT